MLVGLKGYNVFKLQVCESFRPWHLERSRQLLYLYRNKLKKSKLYIVYTFTELELARIYFFLERWKLLRKKKINTKIYAVYSLLANPCFLLLIYTQLRTSRSFYVGQAFSFGARANLALSAITKLSAQLLSKTYALKPSTFLRVSFNRKTHPILSVPSTKDALLQYAIAFLLANLFKINANLFTHINISFWGYSVLSHLKTYWSGCQWFVTFFIKNVNSLSFQRVFILEVSIFCNDKSFIQLLSAFFSFGYISVSRFLKSNLRFPRVGRKLTTLNLVCCEIYFVNFDNWVSHLMALTQSSNINLCYSNCFIGKFIINFSLNKFAMLGLYVIKYFIVLTAHIKRHVLMPYSVFQTVYYMRFIDFFMFGISGTQKVANTILSVVSNFLYGRLYITLCKASTKILYSSVKVAFLGYNIFSVTNSFKGGTSLKLCVPVRDLFSYFCRLGFFLIGSQLKSFYYFARRVNRLLYVQNSSIIVTFFNKLILSIYLFYGLFSKIFLLYPIYVGLVRSCFLTMTHYQKNTRGFWSKNVSLSYNTFTPFLYSLAFLKNNTAPFPNKDLFVIFDLCSIFTRDTLLFNLQPITELFCIVPKCKLQAHYWYQFSQVRFNSPVGKKVPVCQKHFFLLTYGTFSIPVPFNWIGV